MKQFLLGAVALFSISTSAQQPVQLQLVPWAGGLSNTVDLANAGDSRLFVVDRVGIIRIISDSMVVEPVPFLDMQAQVNHAQSEQGLLGLAFDPDYANNGFFYVNYTAGSGAGVTRISRFKVSADPDSADAASEEIIYTVTQPYWNHNGGDLDFGPDGHLYIGMGDGGSGNDPQNHAQNLGDPLGDMLRIHPESDSTYSIPLDNPWVNSGPDTLPEIWASGLRNPWRFGFDGLTGDLWIGDVGQNAYEEVDFWAAGDNSGPNFGWRCYEANATNITSGCLPSSNYVFPVTEHDNVGIGGDWCSSIGGRVYRGTEFPHLIGKYIYTDYCAGDFWVISPDGLGGWVDQVGLNTTSVGYAVIAEGTDGSLFVGNETNGTVRKIIDKCPMDAPVLSYDSMIFTSTLAVSYQWYLNGMLIPGATGQSYTPTASGSYHVVGTFVNNCMLPSDTIFHLISGIGELANDGFMVYPVPASRALFVQRTTAGNASVSLQLLDAAGRSVLQQPWASNSGTLEVDIQDLSEGTYTVVIRNGSGEMMHRSVVPIMH